MDVWSSFLVAYFLSVHQFPLIYFYLHLLTLTPSSVFEERVRLKRSNWRMRMMKTSGVEEWDLWVVPSFFVLALVLSLSPVHAASLALDSSSPALSPFLFLLTANDYFCADVLERVNDET
jgi:hypothetical protein